MTMKPTVTEAEIASAFRAGGVPLARKFDKAISFGLGKDKATQIDPLAEKLVDVGHPLRSERLREWDQVVKVLALNGWPVLRDLQIAGTQRVPRTRLGVRWWLRTMFPELGPPEDLSPLAAEPPRRRRARVDAALNTALEEYAIRVAQLVYTRRYGPGSVRRVDHLPRSLDLLVSRPNGNMRVEVKARKGQARRVEVTDGEVGCSQLADPCVLFVVDLIAVDFDADYTCTGGRWREYPWRVREGDPCLRATRYSYSLGNPTASAEISSAR
jgi:hypothetical protein